MLKTFALMGAGLLAFTATAPAAVLYSNGTPVQANGTLIGETTGSRAVAETFNLAVPSNILTFEFSNWIVDNSLASASATPLTINWAVSTTGIGGTPLLSGTNTALTVVPGTSSTFNSGQITQSLVTFSAGNVWLPAGTYWLELYGEKTTPAISASVTARWGGVSPDANDAQVYNGTLVTLQPSHFLEVIGVPEPASLLVLSAGLGGLAAARRRSRQTSSTCSTPGSDFSA